eukprot:CAMPEP_0117758820 /NCGR_PEP_ID=MMETSP0947-20121206/15633_1 /TAXON_ID=44440 /ORGANISM="Chattonella subsalsa, Strain CCMP2191" /LENGTH=280 /DNA_ID=CAMNT_0005579135 /DNA_START=95 /DNA_END=937 /DNA_ORIENTATION=-
MGKLIVVLLFLALATPSVAFVPSHSSRFVFRSSRPLSSLRSVQETKTAEIDVTSAATQLDVTSTAAQIDESELISDDLVVSENDDSGFSYAAFAQRFPFANNIMIATLKTAAADLLAQTVIAQVPLGEIDLQRSFLFCLFGAIYLGGFQYLYQVQIFKRLFDVDKFTSQSWTEKLQDGPGLRALAAQTALDLTVLTIVYLPTFYIFKASVFSGSGDPSAWFAAGIENYLTNFYKDEFDLIRVWAPADLICFSVPLYLRLPVRHVVSFVWTAYLSFARGGH